MTLYSDLVRNLEQLRLNTVKEYLPHYLDENLLEQMSVVDILKELTDKEIAVREERAAQISLKTSNFPYQKTVADFDFAYQPTVSRAQILDFCSLRFMESADNILFIGPSGVGKTHLATAIGMEASRKHFSTYFIHFNTLIAKLKKAHLQNRQEIVLKCYSKYKLLIIDEIGYLPVEKTYANLFFQLIAARYERKSTIVTSNLPLSNWSEVFSDPVIASAIIDRLVHHSSVVKINGRSYRLKGLVPDELSSPKSSK